MKRRGASQRRSFNKVIRLAFNGALGDYPVIFRFWVFWPVGHAPLSALTRFPREFAQLTEVVAGRRDLFDAGQSRSVLVLRGGEQRVERMRDAISRHLESAAFPGLYISRKYMEGDRVRTTGQRRSISR